MFIATTQIVTILVSKSCLAKVKGFSASIFETLREISSFRIRREPVFDVVIRMVSFSPHVQPIQVLELFFCSKYKAISWPFWLGLGIQPIFHFQFTGEFCFAAPTTRYHFALRLRDWKWNHTDRKANECQCWVVNIKQVTIQVVNLLTIRDQLRPFCSAEER